MTIQSAPSSFVGCPRCGEPGMPGVAACDGCGAIVRSPGRLHPPGTVLGSYKLLEVLGEGGMGVVYLAEHVRLGRRVALKTLRSDDFENRSAVHRFFGEARAVNRIHHPHIVEITDFVEDTGGDNYYIMELLRGTTLAKVVQACAILPLARSIGIMTQVAEALEAVHNAGIVHRDLKPDNVFLTERAGQVDFVKLLDFGVAKLLGTDQIPTHTTAAGAILGTPTYMSPEQASGKVVGIRTDVYSFGVVLYELVTGTLPLVGASFGELVVKHLTVAPLPPSMVPHVPHTVPAELEDVILACLAKDPLDRPATMAVVRTRLEAIADANGWPLARFTDSPRVTGKSAVVLEPLRKDRSGPAIAPTLAVELPPTAAPAPAPTTPAPARSRPRLWWFVAGAGGAVVPVVVVAAMIAAALNREPDEPWVDLELATVPAGADVVRAHDHHVFGKTPLVLHVPRSDHSWEIELRLADYASSTQVIKLDRSVRIATVLAPIPHPPPTPTPPEPPPAVVQAPPPAPPPRAAIVARPIPPPKRPAVHAPAPRPRETADRNGVLDPFAP